MDNESGDGETEELREFDWEEWVSSLILLGRGLEA